MITQTNAQFEEPLKYLKMEWNSSSRKKEWICSRDEDINGTERKKKNCENLNELKQCHPYFSDDDDYYFH